MCSFQPLIFQGVNIQDIQCKMSIISINIPGATTTTTTTKTSFRFFFSWRPDEVLKWAFVAHAPPAGSEGNLFGCWNTTLISQPAFTAYFRISGFTAISGGVARNFLGESYASKAVEGVSGQSYWTNGSGGSKVWRGRVAKDSYESFLVFVLFFKGGKIVKQPCPYLCSLDAWEKIKQYSPKW